MEGWQCLRLTLEQGGGIVGGAQILWRKTRFGRIGYLLKGPVLGMEISESAPLMVELVKQIICSHRLLALIVQPPDFCQSLPAALADGGFSPDRLMGVISATCMVHLSGAPGAWEAGVARTKMVQTRRAVRRGVTIRKGGPGDSGLFFELMSATCARQGVRPNPPSEEALRHLVSVFARGGAARVSFAEVAGESVACVLDLKFGNRVTSWKKGWNGRHPETHPNTFLAWESIRWAASQGCAHLDFAGMSRSLAESVLSGRELTEEQKKMRDVFNLGFGARPLLLTPALICWRNPVARFLYARAIRHDWMTDTLNRAAKKFGSA